MIGDKTLADEKFVVVFVDEEQNKRYVLTEDYETKEITDSSVVRKYYSLKRLYISFDDFNQRPFLALIHNDKLMGRKVPIFLL